MFRNIIKGETDDEEVRPRETLETNLNPFGAFGYFHENCSISQCEATAIRSITEGRVVKPTEAMTERRIDPQSMDQDSRGWDLSVDPRTGIGSELCGVLNSLFVFNEVFLFPPASLRASNGHKISWLNCFLLYCCT